MRFDRRLEAVAKAVGGGYCRLQTPLRLAVAVRGTVAGHRLGGLGGGGRGGYLPPFQCIPGRGVGRRSHGRGRAHCISVQGPVVAPRDTASKPLMTRAILVMRYGPLISDYEVWRKTRQQRF